MLFTEKQRLKLFLILVIIGCLISSKCSGQEKIKEIPKQTKHKLKRFNWNNSTNVSAFFITYKNHGEAWQSNGKLCFITQYNNIFDCIPLNKTFFTFDSTILSPFVYIEWNNYPFLNHTNNYSYYYRNNINRAIIGFGIQEKPVSIIALFDDYEKSFIEYKTIYNPYLYGK